MTPRRMWTLDRRMLHWRNRDALGNSRGDVAYCKTNSNIVFQEGNMTFRLKGILAVLLFSAVPIVLAQDAATDVKKGAEATGHDTKVAAKDTAKGTEKAADKTGVAAEKGAKATGTATKKAATTV